MSLGDVSKCTGWHFTTIAGWERGERQPSPDKLNALADIYKVSTDYLLGRTDDPAPPSKEKIPHGTIAAYRFSGYDKLSPEVKRQLDDYIEYIVNKYSPKDEGDEGDDSD